MAIVQARFDSKRLPGKTLASIGDRTVLDFTLQRLMRCDTLDSIVLATTQLQSDDALVVHARLHDVPVFRGDVDDVLGRIFSAAVESNADYVVRITADCPLIDPATCDQVVKKAHEQALDFVTNYIPPTFPDGLDVSVIRFSTLNQAHNEAMTPHDREHVTTYIEREMLTHITWSNVDSRNNESDRRWTVDTIEDLTFLRRLNDKVGHELAHMNYQEILDALQSGDDLTDAGNIYERNFGHTK